MDWDLLERSLSEKTKILILNTPNNPTGKIITYDEMRRIQKILEKWPQVIVVMDEVYEHMVYDEYEALPRMASLEGMWEKTLTISSAGKIFSATGVRIGWAIGPQKLISRVHAIEQYNTFCIYEPMQNALAECLDVANLPYKGADSYYKWLNAEYSKNRKLMVESLAKLDKFGLDFWLPEGGYFIIADISNVQNDKRYKFEGEEDQENKYSKDFNYILNMAHEKHVVGIPCSPFYTVENLSIGSNYIRLAFCKKEETLNKALENLSKF